MTANTGCGLRTTAFSFYYVGNIASDISGIKRKSTANCLIGAADFLIVDPCAACCVYCGGRIMRIKLSFHPQGLTSSMPNELTVLAPFFGMGRIMGCAPVARQVANMLRQVADMGQYSWNKRAGSFSLWTEITIHITLQFHNVTQGTGAAEYGLRLFSTRIALK